MTFHLKFHPSHRLWLGREPREWQQTEEHPVLSFSLFHFSLPPSLSLLVLAPQERAEAFSCSQCSLRFLLSSLSLSGSFPKSALLWSIWSVFRGLLRCPTLNMDYVPQPITGAFGSRSPPSVPSPTAFFSWLLLRQFKPSVPSEQCILDLLKCEWAANPRWPLSPDSVIVVASAHGQEHLFYIYFSNSRRLVSSQELTHTSFSRGWETSLLPWTIFNLCMVLLGPPQLANEEWGWKSPLFSLTPHSFPNGPSKACSSNELQPPLT